MSRFFPFFMFTLAVVLCQPWGDFPTNDDWQYAHVAKTFAETGRFLVDVPIAPSLYGQSLLASIFIKVFGFSHFKLRMLTVLLSYFCLIFIEGLMTQARCAPRVKVLFLSLIALNPIFFALSLSFMSEIYGFVLALMTSFLWFSDDRTEHLPLPTFERATVCATLGAFCFWTRQFSALFFPALLVSSTISFYLGKKPPFKNSMKMVLSKLGFPALVYALLILAYFPWSMRTNNFRVEFAGPLENLMSAGIQNFDFQILFFIFYMTCFFSPFFVQLIPDSFCLGASIGMAMSS